MPASFREILRSDRIMFFDGGMGTQLTERGAERSPAANVHAPDAVLAVHRAYREAGADVLLTNTLTASRPALARSGEADQLARYVAAGCALARKAAALAGPFDGAQGRPAFGSEAQARRENGRMGGFVAGDIGPAGELLEPYGTMTEAAMRAAFEETARLLAAGGVDLYVVETMSDIREMTLAVAACRAAAKELPVAATMAFDPSRQGGFRTSMGVSPTDAARAMAAAGADIVGANCGAITPEQMAEVVREFRRATGRPVTILAQPNAGLPELRAGQTVFGLSPEAFAAGMMQVLAAGARLVGGCCGTTPAHIAALVAATKQRTNTQRPSKGTQ